MPAYDLSPYNLARVANQDVDMLRIANVDVWTAQAPLETTFAGASIVLSSNNDTPAPNSWIAQQYHRLVADDLEVASVGIFVPTGSFLAGKSGKVGLQFGASGYTIPHTYANDMQGAYDINIGPLVEGWNWADYPTPIPWISSDGYVLAAYNLGIYYLHSSSLDSGAFPSELGSFELVDALTGTDEPSRGFYDSGTDTFSPTVAKCYGIDIRARKAG